MGMSTRIRLLSYFGLLSLAGAITFVVLWMYGVPQWGIEGVQSAEYRRTILAMESLADKERDVFAQWFVERRRELRLTVGNELIADAVRAASQSTARRAAAPRALLERQLVRIKEANAGVYNALYIVNPANGLVLASTEPGATHPAPEHASILTESSQPGLTEFVHLVQGPRGPELVVTNQVIATGAQGYADGQLLGVLVARVDLRTALANEEEIMQQSLGPAGGWALLDREQKVLVATEASRIPNGGGPTDDWLRQAVESGSEGFKVLQNADGRDVLMAFRHLNIGASDGLTLALMRDADEALGATRTTFRRLIAVGVAVFLSAMVLVLFAASRIAATEREILNLNAHLEARVVERTDELEQANHSLIATLDRLKRTQDDLVESEKLASLGAMVAGVAHELNTPIGVALTAASTLGDQARQFTQSAKSGLSRSAFEAYLEATKTGTDMIQANIARAAELITGFKQLAVDQASAQRRKFNLGDEFREIRVVMGPTLKSQPFSIEIGSAADAIEMDSYPGVLSRTLINLVQNAVFHGFEGRSRGVIQIHARLIDGEQVEIRFADDGNGMTDEVRKHVFDPFFTTKMGRGGSGLGMHIVYNNVTKLLGGRIELETAPGEGTRYRLVLPLCAAQSA